MCKKIASFCLKAISVFVQQTNYNELENTISLRGFLLKAKTVFFSCSKRAVLTT